MVRNVLIVDWISVCGSWLVDMAVRRLVRRLRMRVKSSWGAGETRGV